ncbi:unnamed protein product [Paramecium sonneborni]|uniref:Uncharacterized protein n=1 Tax=Paramecium sonneborni TaxID=65129 RepID=A0A8S1LI76_9CILI|nr:unnamed protein product [Paramecium sonneborni]
MQNNKITSFHLKKMLTPIQNKKSQDQFFQNQIQSFVHLKSYMPINPLRLPQRKHKKVADLTQIDDIKQLIQQKQQIRKTLSNGSTLQTFELPEYIGVQTIVEENDEKAKSYTKQPSPSYVHYHNHTKQVMNLMKNAHQQLSPVIGKKKLEANLIETLDFNQFKRLMKAIYQPKKQLNKQVPMKKRTYSEKIFQNKPLEQNN